MAARTRASDLIKYSREPSPRLPVVLLHRQSLRFLFLTVGDGDSPREACKEKGK